MIRKTYCGHMNGCCIINYAFIKQKMTICQLSHYIIIPSNLLVDIIGYIGPHSSPNSNAIYF